MSIKNERRRNYFIDKKFQTKFIAHFCVLLVVASVLIAIMTYTRNMQTTTVAFENLRVVVKSTSDFIIPIVVEVLFIVTILTGTATIIVTLFTSHKIAGPLYKLSAEIAKIKNGDLSSIVRIRAKDQLQNLATEFNELRTSLNSSIKEIKSDWADIDSVIKKVDLSSVDAKEKKKLQNALESLEQHITHYKTN